MDTKEPTTFVEGEHEDYWHRVMLDELSSIADNATWTLTTLLPGHGAIGLKLVFKVKKNEDGTIIKHKARLVEKGYAQQGRVDFEEVFAPVARPEFV